MRLRYPWNGRVNAAPRNHVLHKGSYVREPFPGRPRRPGALNATVACSIASAPGTFAGALAVVAGGRPLAERNVEQAVQEDPQLLGLPAGTTTADLKAMAGPATAATLPALATAVAAAVLAWLPPSGRYAEQLGNGMRNAPAPQPPAAFSG